MNTSTNEKSNGARIEPRLLKGFRDFGPASQLKRQEMFLKLQTTFQQFGFLPMATPVLEYKDILMGKYGDDEKLVYSFKDNGDRDVAMRYDLTVPLARFIAQNQNTLTFPFKRYQIAPVWRADNPQKGRFREFYQCDVDVVGSNSPLADAEVIACLCKALEELGIKNYEVRINDRRNFEVFGENAERVIRSLDKIDKIGKDKVLEEISNANPGLVEQARAFIDGETVLQYEENLKTLKQNITNLGIPESNISINRNIARGLDYYTSTVFEIFILDKPEFGSICGGGRYDSLVDQFSKESVSAVGGSIGLDRLLDAMFAENPATVTSTNAIVFNLGEEFTDLYLQTLKNLRDAGVATEMYYESAKIDKQFKYAENNGIKWAVIIGQEESTSGQVKLKNLLTREQQELSLKDLPEFLKNNL